MLERPLRGLHGHGGMLQTLLFQHEAELPENVLFFAETSVARKSLGRWFRGGSGVTLLLLIFLLLFFAELLDVAHFATSITCHLVHPTFPFDVGLLTSSTEVRYLVGVGRIIGVGVVGSRVFFGLGVRLLLLFLI